MFWVTQFQVKEMFSSPEQHSYFWCANSGSAASFTARFTIISIAIARWTELRLSTIYEQHAWEDFLNCCSLRRKQNCLKAFRGSINSGGGPLSALASSDSAHKLLFSMSTPDCSPVPRTFYANFGRNSFSDRCDSVSSSCSDKHAIKTVNRLAEIDAFNMQSFIYYVLTNSSRDQHLLMKLLFV